MTLTDRILSLLVGGPIRAVLAGAALLCVGALALRWWLVVLIAAGAIAERVRFPGRLPRGWWTS